MKMWTKVFAIFFMSFFWLPQSQAALRLIGNEVTNTLSFTNPNDFSGAQYHQRQSITQTADAAGDTGGFTFAGSVGSFSNFTATGDSHIAISGLNILPASATFTRTSTDGQTGTFAMDFDRIANTNANLTTSVVGGFYVLEHKINSSTALVAGSPFSFEIVIQGDWSASGAASGSHQLLDINPLWTIDQDFTFTGGSTVFSGHIDSYINDGLHNARVDFLLIGAPVPEPETYAMMVAGLGLLGFVARRRKLQPAT